MTYAPKVAGYETTVDQRATLFQSGQFVAMGDGVKAAKAMIDVVANPESPLHLVLGSDAAGMLKHADERRKAEFEKMAPRNHVHRPRRRTKLPGNALWKITPRRRAIKMPQSKMPAPEFRVPPS